VALHLLLILTFPDLEKSRVVLLVDAVAFALAVAAEQITITVAGRAAQRGS
jgi:hypothetical protein